MFKTENLDQDSPDTDSAGVARFYTAESDQTWNSRVTERKRLEYIGKFGAGAVV